MLSMCIGKERFRIYWSFSEAGLFKQSCETDPEQRCFYTVPHL